MSFFSKIAHAVGSGVKAVGGAARAVGNAAGSIPVVGKGIKAGFNLTVGAPFQVADDIVRGKRIDKVAFDSLKRNVQDIKAVAPYAQMVLQAVPGVGNGLAGVIGAGLALSEGQNVTKALAEGVRSALPGGPLAAAAFDVGAAAMQGKPLDQIALNALPIPAEQKRLVAQALAMAKDVATGKRVDTAILEAAERQLPPEVRNAMKAGMTLAHAAHLQSVVPAKTARPVAGGLAFVFPKSGVSLSQGVAQADRILGAYNSKDPNAVASARRVVARTTALAKTGNSGANNAYQILTKRAAALRVAKRYRVHNRTGHLVRVA